MLLFKGHNNYYLELILYIPIYHKNEKSKPPEKGLPLLKKRYHTMFFEHDRLTAWFGDYCRSING